MEKISIARLKRAAKEKLTNQYGVTLGTFMIMIAILTGLCISLVFALSWTLIPKLLEGMDLSVLNAETITQEQFMNLEMELLEKTDTLEFDLMFKLASLVVGALMATLTSGFTYVCLRISRNEKACVRDLFYVYKNNPDKVIILYALVFVVQFIVGLPAYAMYYAVKNRPDDVNLNAIYTVLNIICFVASYIVSLMLSQVYFLYLDDPQAGVMDSLRNSMAMMQGNKGRLLYLEISFIGWLLLIAVSFGIASIWVLPYMELTLAEFYRTTKGEELWISTQSYQEN